MRGKDLGIFRDKSLGNSSKDYEIETTGDLFGSIKGK